ncbi:MAG: hypothetical protein ACRDJG_09995 [Actinomycetota bacterium]
MELFVGPGAQAYEGMIIVEMTSSNIRLRKRVLDRRKRMRALGQAKQASQG